MNKAFLPVFAALALTSVIGNAEPYPRGNYVPHYQVKWWFVSQTCTAGVCMSTEDYSTNLAVPRAVSLPSAAVKQGWSCVRLPIEETKAAEFGYFRCSNGTETQQSLAQCSLTGKDSNLVWMALTVDTRDGKEVNITMKSKCENQEVVDPSVERRH